MVPSLEYPRTVNGSPILLVSWAMGLGFLTKQTLHMTVLLSSPPATILCRPQKSLLGTMSQPLTVPCAAASCAIIRNFQHWSAPHIIPLLNNLLLHRRLQPVFLVTFPAS